MHSTMRLQHMLRRPLALFLTTALLMGLALSFPGVVVQAAAPTITDLYVTTQPGERTGSTAGGTPITIVGTNLTNVTTVRVNGRPATGVLAAGTTLTFVTPAAGGIEETLNGTTIEIWRLGDAEPTVISPTSPLAFWYRKSTPRIDSLSRDRGPSFGGNEIVIDGDEFHPNAKVYFGNTPATSVTVINPRQMRVVVPAHAVGTTTLRVVNPDGGELTGPPTEYTFVLVPDIISVVPISGSPDGGDEVTITGSNFPTNNTIVMFGLKQAQVLEATANRLVVRTPEGLGCVDVSVEGTAGEAGKWEGQYCYRSVAPTPQVDFVSPAQGTVDGGTEITIHGDNFINGVRVRIGGIEVPVNPQHVTNKTIRVMTPAHGAGPVDVQVINPSADGDRVGVLPNGFLYVVPGGLMNITNVTPLQGSVEGGTRVRIHGTNLKNPTTQPEYKVTAEFGGNPAPDDFFTVLLDDDGERVVGYEVVAPAGSLPNTSVDVALLLWDVSGPTPVLLQRVVAPFQYTYVSPESKPEITRVVQEGTDYSYGPAATPFVVTIEGSDFREPVTVTFDGRPAVPGSVRVHEGGTRITATVPAFGQPAPVTVEVQNTDGATAMRVNALQILGNTMQLYSVEPGAGSEFGGQIVTLIGAGLDQDLMPDADPEQAARHYRVWIGGVPAKVLQVIPGSAATGPARIRVETGRGTPGVKDVVVSNRYGQTSLSQAYTYTPETTRPKITGLCVVDDLDNVPAACPPFDPDDVPGGSSVGGDWLLITGEQFYSHITVLIGGAPVAATELISDERLLVQTGKMQPDLEPVAVTVINKDGGTGTLDKAFRVISTPQLTSADPFIVAETGGAIVTLTGAEFLPGIAVAVGTDPTPPVDPNDPRIVAPEQVLRVDDTRVRFRVPPTASGPLIVFVKNQDNATWTAAPGLLLSQPPALNPQITRISPTDGTYVGGEEIHIIGSDFAEVADDIQVWFGLYPAALIGLLAPDHLAVISPPAPDGVPLPHPVPVTVVNRRDGSAFVSEPGAGPEAGFTYRLTGPAPVLTRVSPSHGSVAGGDIVTLHGSDFFGAVDHIEVMFGLNPAAEVISRTHNTIVVKTPPAAQPGPVDVVVTNPDGGRARLGDGFTYTNSFSKPEITSVFPAAGTTDGGTDIVITGSGFLVPLEVYIGGVPATHVSVHADDDGEYIRAKTPPGEAGQVHVTVVNYDGGAATWDELFEYISADTISRPQITDISPALGPVHGGTVISIHGQWFLGNMDDPTTLPVVTVGGKQATVLSIAHNLITAETPPGQPGRADVTVTNRDGGSVTRTGGFTYGLPPATIRITGIVPNFGPASGGNWVTITGVDFDPAARVFIGGTEVDPPALADPDDPKVIVAPDGRSLNVLMPPAPEDNGRPVLGPQDVTVRNPDATEATAAGGYTYLNPASAPRIVSVEPQAVSTRGGDYVTITGEDFRQGVNVYFGALAAASVQRISETELLVRTPAHPAGQVRLTVLNEDGGTDDFTWITFDDPRSNPRITQLTPAEGHVEGGTVVVIEGQDFRHDPVNGPIEVRFGGVRAQSVTYESHERLRVVTPPSPGGVEGSVDVTVINRADGDVASFTLPNGFRYTTERPPAPPTGDLHLTLVSVSDRSVLLQWNALEGAVYYQIEARLGTDGVWQPAGQSTATTWRITGLSPDTAYYFRVRAVNELGESKESNYVFARTLRSGTSVTPGQAAHTVVSGGQASIVVHSREALNKMGGMVVLGQPPYDRYDRKEIKLGAGLVNDFAYVTADFGDVGLVLTTWSLRFAELRNRNAGSDAFAQLVAQRLTGLPAEAALRSLPAGYRAISPVYDFTLAAQVGRRFTAAPAWLVPVQLSVPLPQAYWQTPAEQLALLRYDPATRMWETVDKGIWYRQVTADISQAGRYVLVVRP